jgi:hypothetical protein
MTKNLTQVAATNQERVKESLKTVKKAVIGVRLISK